MIGLRAVSDLVRGDLVDESDLLDLVSGDGAAGDLDALMRGGEHQSPRIRPLLVALSARAAGAGQVDPDLQHAAEILHIALVTQDLTLGRSGGRRRRMARRIFDRSAGFLGGSHLTLRALELVRHAPSPLILGELLDTLREVVVAQALASDLQEGGLPTRHDWLEHADAHTGAVFSFCCRAGALLGHADPAALSALGRYGRHLGRVWNVAEDITALRRDHAGAHLLERALSGRPVLPVVEVAWDDERVARAWDALLARPRRVMADALAEDVVRKGGIARARKVMARDSWAARRALRGVPESRYRDGLDKLARDLVQA